MRSAVVRRPAPFGSVFVARVIQAAIALWALVLVYRFRRRAPEWIFIPALIGGLLASPYLHLDDLAMLGLAAWLYLRTQPPAWTWAVLFAVVVIAEGVPIWGAAPLIVGEVLVLVLLSVESGRALGPVPTGALGEAPRPLLRLS